MISAHRAKVLKLVSQAAIYVEDNAEGIRIDSYTEVPDSDGEMFIFGEGEETGETYCIDFNDVDLSNCSFYKLELIVAE